MTWIPRRSRCSTRTSRTRAACRTTSPPYVILQVGCARIGLFGLVTEPYDESDTQSGFPYDGTFAQSADYVSEAQRTTDTLRGMGVDAVIGITHLGAAEDHVLVDSVTGLDLVVGGHDHVYYSAPYVGAAGGESVDVGAYAEWIGHFDVTVDLTAHHIVYPPRGGYTTLQVASLPDPPAADVDGEVQRMIDCFAPQAALPLVRVQNPIPLTHQTGFTTPFDAAIRAQFPDDDALLYETWSDGKSVLKRALGGTLTEQELLDSMYVERERPGTPGFTSLYDVPLSGSSLAALCAAPLAGGASEIHRVCPAAIAPGTTYHLVIEKRDLFDPSYAFSGDTSFMPSPGSVPIGSGIESFDVLLPYARARGLACEYLDTGAPCACF